MKPFLKYLLLCVTVVTVGAMQVAGAQAFFFCGCTGKNTLQESCGTSCHSELQCPANHSSRQHSDPGDAPCLPAEPEHQHGEVVVKLIATTAPSSFLAPSVVWLAVMTDPFAALFKSDPGFDWPACRTQPLESPVLTGSVRVPHAMVMLV